MGTFDSFQYDIESRMPEWWKEDALAKSVNVYTQDLIASIIEGLLSNLGLVQPINVWKTIPEEYNWYHHYKILDDYLIFEGEDSIQGNSTCTFFANSKVMAYLPNTKRKCHARIHLRLLGNEEDNKNALIDSLKISNGNQEIYLRNVPKTAIIDILTETKQVFIDGVEAPSTSGFFDLIQPNIKYEDFLYPDGTELSVQDENKETKITFESSNPVDFDLQIYLLKPTYVTEQNIRVASVSAFPIEKIELWGYFCHPFNNKQGYEFLWEKKYDIRNRTVYDRITKQYDCERFFVKVKFHGLGTALVKGFPQEEFSSNSAFQINDHLDKWGKIYGLPRRHYRTDIREEEEPFTYPKYYNYPIEQDYWYEERLVNEYRYVDDAINSNFIKDSDLNNVARLECIHPNTDDIWVYTETIDASQDINREVKDIPVHDIEVIEDSPGIEIQDIDMLKLGKPTTLTHINPYNNDISKLNDSSYRTKRYKISFDLRPFKEDIPKDIEITGIELKFKTPINLRSNLTRITDDSCMLLPFYSPIYQDFKIGRVDISGERRYWERNKNYLTIGGENQLFNEKEITREQIFSGKNQHLEFEIAFINDNDFLVTDLLLENITLGIYYKIISDDYDIDIDISQKTIYLNKDPRDTKIDITVTNNSKKEMDEKELFIILPNELRFKEGSQSYKFSFEMNEDPFTISTIIEPAAINNEFKTGYYDILIFCEDKVFKREILVRNGE